MIVVIDPIRITPREMITEALIRIVHMTPLLNPINLRTDPQQEVKGSGKEAH